MPEHSFRKNIGLLIELLGLTIILIAAGVQVNTDNTSSTINTHRLSQIERKIDTFWFTFSELYLQYLDNKPNSMEHFRDKLTHNKWPNQDAGLDGIKSALSLVKSYIFPLYFTGSLLIIGGKLYKEWQIDPKNTSSQSIQSGMLNEITQNPTNQTRYFNTIFTKIHTMTIINFIKSWLNNCNTITKQRFWFGIVSLFVSIITIISYYYFGVFCKELNYTSEHEIIIKAWWCIASTCFGFGSISLTYINNSNSKWHMYLFRYIPLTIIISTISFSFGEIIICDYLINKGMPAYIYYTSTFSIGGGLGFYIDKLSNILKINN